MDRHTRFMPAVLFLFDQMNRHRIQYFIGEYHPVKPLWQRRQPFDVIESRQGFLLSLAQFGRQFQNPVFFDPDSCSGQSSQNIERQFSRSCTRFKNVRPRLLQQRDHCLCQSTAVQVRHFGSCREITRFSQFHQSTTVVSQ